jgi:hypothetical protein
VTAADEQLAVMCGCNAGAENVAGASDVAPLIVNHIVPACPYRETSRSSVSQFLKHVVQSVLWQKRCMPIGQQLPYNKRDAHNACGNQVHQGAQIFLYINEGQ